MQLMQAVKHDGLLRPLSRPSVAIITCYQYRKYRPASMSVSRYQLISSPHTCRQDGVGYYQKCLLYCLLFTLLQNITF